MYHKKPPTNQAKELCVLDQINMIFLHMFQMEYKWFLNMYIWFWFRSGFMAYQTL